MRYNVVARNRRFSIEVDNITQAEGFCIGLLHLQEGEQIEIQADCNNSMTHIVTRRALSDHWHHKGYEFGIRPDNYRI